MKFNKLVLSLSLVGAFAFSIPAFATGLSFGDDNSSSSSSSASSKSNANAGAAALASTGNSTSNAGGANVNFQDRLQFPNLPPATAGSRAQGTECPIITEISNGKQVFVLFGSSTVGKEASLVNGICVLYWRAKESGATEDWKALSDYAAETDPVYKKVMKVAVPVEVAE